MIEPDLAKVEEVKTQLAALFNPTRRWSLEEEAQVRLLMRIPNYMKEVESVVHYHQCLNPYERKFFPHSMQRLLSDWTAVLDRIAISATITTKKDTSAQDKVQNTWELKRVEARIKVLKERNATDGNVSITWPVEEREELKRLKSRRAMLMVNLNLIA